MLTAIRAIIRRLGFDIVRYQPPELPPDFTQEEKDLIRRVQPYTMTSPERIWGLVQAVRYVVESGIPGDIVECGVWRGGSMMAAALALIALGRADRNLHLFDTFEGMPAPGPHDVDLEGNAAELEFQSCRRERGSDWCLSPLEEVRRAMLTTGYEPQKIFFVAGRVEETIPRSAPERIALLRLDTDWYESTAHELEHLFPRLSRGGVLIVDDYGHWRGSRRATDEFIRRHGLRLFLGRMDYTGRIAIKS